jgi:demethylmenaquinone methyltransferase/2-methoxy-6-polyprenyl-1,4-benzoquinol methylase
VDTDALLAEQVSYYRARAAEYDDWWFRRARYDNGPEWNARWFAEAAEVESALERFAARGDVLELACGTGLWTRHLARTATHLTAVDASPEVIELNRTRVGDAAVEYVEADIFDLQLSGRYDACCFGFWLSHVPEGRFAEFWDGVGRALRPDGRVFFVDSGIGRSDRVHTRDRAAATELRRLSDGREFRIVKRYHEPRELERRLAGLGFRFTVSTTSRGSMIYGVGSHG